MRAGDVVLLVLAVACVVLGTVLISAMWLGAPDLGLVR